MRNFLSGAVDLLRQYRTLFFLGVISAVGELAFGVMNQSAIPPYVQQIKLTAHMGLIYAMFLVVETALKSPMGSLGDRLGRRPLIVGGALISCCTALVMARSTALPLILVLRALDGVAAAAIWPTLIAAVGGSVPPGKRTSAMSVITVTYIAGVALGPFIGGLVNDTTGSKAASFYLVSLLFLATALVAFFFTPHKSREDVEAQELERTKIRLSDLLVGLKTIPDMMALALLAFFGIGLLIPVVKLFAMDELGLSETRFGVMVLPVAVFVGLASLAAGRLGDRWGKARSVRAGILLSAAAMWGVSFSHHPGQFAAAAVFLGIGFVLAMPAWLALVSDIAAPQVRGAVVGALGTAQGVGAVVGAYLGSHLYEMQSIRLLGYPLDPQYSPFIVSAGALTACLVLAIVFVKDHDPRRIGHVTEMRGKSCSGL